MENDRHGPFQCPICYEAIKKPVMLKSCQHTFCNECIMKWIESQSKDHTCPFCRQKIQLRKKPIIKIKPKFDSILLPKRSEEVDKRLSSAETLADLREQLAAKRAELTTMRTEYNDYEQKQKISLEMLDSQVEGIRQVIKPLHNTLAEQQKQLDKVMTTIPITALFFDQICHEVMKDKKLVASETYENIHQAWLAACSHSKNRRQQRTKLENIRKQFLQIQRRNITARTAVAQLGPEEFSRRVSNDTFERLCSVMKWNYRDFVTPATTPSITSLATNSAKRTLPMLKSIPSASTSTHSMRPVKMPKKISFFDNDLVDMQDIC